MTVKGLGGGRLDRWRARRPFRLGKASNSYGFPFGASQGFFPGIASGLGIGGWAIAFVVIFFIAIVFWTVWRAIGNWYLAEALEVWRVWAVSFIKEGSDSQTKKGRVPRMR